MNEWKVFKRTFQSIMAATLVILFATYVVAYALIGDTRPLVLGTVFSIPSWVSFLIVTLLYSRPVWSFVYTSVDGGKDAVVKDIEAALKAAPSKTTMDKRGMTVFHLGWSRILVMKYLGRTRVFVGPLGDDEEVERLKGLVERTMDAATSS